MKEPKKRKTEVSPRRSTLAEAIRLKLAERNVSQDEFATRNYLDHDAFRTQLARNTFPSATLKKLPPLLDCPSDQLAHRYDYETMSSPNAGVISPLQARERLIQRSLRVVSRSGDARPQILSSIHDLYTSLGEKKRAGRHF